MSYFFSADGNLTASVSNCILTTDSCISGTATVSGTTITGGVATGSATIQTAYYNPSDFATSVNTITASIKEPEFHPEWNCKPSCLSKFAIIQEPTVVNINIIVPNKVVEVTIYDGKVHTYKQVCKEPDVFDLKYALALALAKYKNEMGCYVHTLTIEGIEWYANIYTWMFKETKREFDRAIKAYNKWLKEKETKEKAEEERKAVIKRRQTKNKRRKEKMKARKKQEEINTIAKAIKLAKE